MFCPVVAARRAAGCTALILAALAAGCGSEPGFPPAAEPAASPPPSEPAAGRVVRVGNAPEGVAADPETGIVALGFRNPDRLALVDGESGRTRRTVRIPSSPRHLGLAGPGGPVLVPTEDGDSLVRVGLPNGSVESTVRVGDEPHDAVQAGGRVFVGNEFGDTVSVIEGEREIRRLPAPLQPGGLAASAAGRVGLVTVKERVFELYDGRALRPLGRIGAGVGPTHVVAEPEGCFYVADTQGDAVLLVVERQGRVEQKRRINVPGSPYGIALDSAADRLYVAQTARNLLSEYSLNGRRPALRRTYPTVRQPNTVAVDERSGRVYVAGRGGLLQIIDPPADRQIPPRPDDARSRCS